MFICIKYELDIVGSVCFCEQITEFLNFSKLFELAIILLSAIPLLCHLPFTGNKAGFPEKWALFWEDSVANCQYVI